MQLTIGSSELWHNSRHGYAQIDLDLEEDVKEDSNPRLAEICYCTIDVTNQEQTVTLSAQTEMLESDKERHRCCFIRKSLERVSLSSNPGNQLMFLFIVIVIILIFFPIQC